MKSATSVLQVGHQHLTKRIMRVDDVVADESDVISEHLRQSLQGCLSCTRLDVAEQALSQKQGWYISSYLLLSEARLDGIRVS